LSLPRHNRMGILFRPFQDGRVVPRATGHPKDAQQQRKRRPQPAWTLSQQSPAFRLHRGTGLAPSASASSNTRWAGGEKRDSPVLRAWQAQQTQRSAWLSMGASISVAPSVLSRKKKILHTHTNHFVPLLDPSRTRRAIRGETRSFPAHTARANAWCLGSRGCSAAHRSSNRLSGDPATRVVGTHARVPSRS
jgi:hypothetical protein